MTPRLTPERVRELLAAATPGPWTHERIGFGGHEVTMDARGGVFVDRVHDAALIAAAPDLAADVLALHDALARVTREREAAVAARDALVTAVRAYLESVDAYDEDDYEDTVGAIDRDRERLDALLDSAPADVVRGDVVRAYLDADDHATVSAEWRDDAARERREAARTALDAALAGCA